MQTVTTIDWGGLPPWRQRLTDWVARRLARLLGGAVTYEEQEARDE